jgi:glycosyltransferase involved in cell wall biosynthesis
MTTVTFLLSKDPEVSHGGDLTLSRLLIRLAMKSSTVRMICLSASNQPSTPGLHRVYKPAVSKAQIALNSVRLGHSLVHTRFDVDAFVPALEASDADVFVAEHSYMAEAYLRSSVATSTSRLLVNTVNSESSVWAVTRGLIGKLDTPRIRRDELRVARAAHSVGSYDADEVADYRRNGVNSVHWLDVTLPPVDRADIAFTGRRLVFLGDRTWPPNDEAFRLLLAWWPLISTGIAGAELQVIGKRSPGPQPALPAGVVDIGFADDLDAALASCRALVAPIMTGGGVRVKILDAASRGLPIVSTAAGIGSLSTVFGLATYDDRDSFVDRCRELLLDRSAAAAEGARLHAANTERWVSGAPQHTVERWLRS